jgi:two-component system sensor histidine kinase/response regulator
LDILMPDMNGFEVLRRLKSEEETREIPIIFLTALPDQESELNGLNLGAVDYIRKPLSIPMVQARLAIHLELARSRKELAKRNEMLEEVVRLRDDIERITRHDMKGPLSAVIGFSEVVLEEAGLSEYHADCLQRSIHAANRMLEMINRSMDLYKIETGRYRYEPRSFDLCRVVNRVCHD